MTESIESLAKVRAEAKEAWSRTIDKLTQDFVEQCEARGHKPEWYEVASASFGEDGSTLTLRWRIRPEIIAAMRLVAEGRPAA